MKRIAIITSTRAEFGLLIPVIEELRRFESKDFVVELVVTGTHLSEEYGYTVNEIEEKHIRIDEMVGIPVDSLNVMSISHNQAKTLEKFTTLFDKRKYSGIAILGDRYEMLAIAIAAGNTKTPIFHLCGGDTTEGAIDEWIRHSITKMSYLHFTTNEISRNRVIQLGESPNRVFNYGSTSIDNILSAADMTKEDAMKSVGITNGNYAIGTYHPVTLGDDSIENLVNSFIEAISSFKDIDFIITKSNSDQGGTIINEMLDKAEKQTSNIHVFTSLGVRRYLSLMRYAEFVIGNSSSGIIETPAFRIPTVNIGDRQRGRLQSESIINCGTDKESIVKAINRAREDEFRTICGNAINRYGNGDSGKRIAKKIFDVVMNEKIDLKKNFYDLRYEG